MICPACNGGGVCPRCRGLGTSWCADCGGRGERAPVDDVPPHRSAEDGQLRGDATPQRSAQEGQLRGDATPQRSAQDGQLREPLGDDRDVLDGHPRGPLPTSRPRLERCASCEGSGLRDCPARCAQCDGSGHVLATVEQAVADEAPREVDEFPPGTVVLAMLVFSCFALESVWPPFRYKFWLNGRQALHGDWWQFGTSLFLHTNLAELGFNLAALLIFGPPLERAIGTARFVLLYLSSGLVGNLLSVATNPYIQTVGASGCLFGVAGAWIGLQLRWRLFQPRVVGLLLAYVVVMLAFGFLTDAPVNNQAHLGGLLFGFVASLALAPPSPPVKD